MRISPVSVDSVPVKTEDIPNPTGRGRCGDGPRYKCFATHPECNCSHAGVIAPQRTLARRAVRSTTSTEYCPGIRLCASVWHLKSGSGVCGEPAQAGGVRHVDQGLKEQIRPERVADDSPSSPGGVLGVSPRYQRRGVAFFCNPRRRCESSLETF